VVRAGAYLEGNMGVATTYVVYECPACEERFVDERRCPDCNVFCAGSARAGAARRAARLFSPMTWRRVDGNGEVRPRVRTEC